jgi:hypothetical protein
MQRSSNGSNLTDTFAQLGRTGVHIVRKEEAVDPLRNSPVPQVRPLS